MRGWYATVRLESGSMTRFYDIDDANETLAELGPILATLVQQREELVRLRDHVLAHGAGAGPPGATGSGPGDGGEAGAAVADDLRLTRLRMQGLIDQMAAVSRASTSSGSPSGTSRPASWTSPRS